MFTKNLSLYRPLRYISLFVLVAVSVILCGCGDKQSNEKSDVGDASSEETEWLSILGGAAGGSFSQFAGGIRQVVIKQTPHLKLSVDGSAGSVENTRRVNEDAEALGVVFASEAYLGYHGKEVFAEEGPKTNIRVVTLLFIAYDQFSTLANSKVHRFEDIVGRKIAVGASGSGTAQTLERLAKVVGIWGKFTPIYKGGTAGAEALQNGQVDGFQWLVSVPNSAVIQLTAIKSIRMLDLDTPAKNHGFYEKYPFYLSGSLPEGAYEGKVKPVKTILMPTVLISHKLVSEEMVYAILKHIYAPEGHETLMKVTQAAADMTLENGPKAFVIPLHRGAYKFWTEHSAAIPSHAMPVD